MKLLTLPDLCGDRQPLCQTTERCQTKDLEGTGTEKGSAKRHNVRCKIISHDGTLSVDANGLG
jgi:hypothetical protein